MALREVQAWPACTVVREVVVLLPGSGLMLQPAALSGLPQRSWQPAVITPVAAQQPALSSAALAQAAAAMHSAAGVLPQWRQHITVVAPAAVTSRMQPDTAERSAAARGAGGGRAYLGLSRSSRTRSGSTSQTSISSL